MSFSVFPTDKFKREAKRLVKKYPSLKQELAGLAATLADGPRTGTSLGHDAYKIRVPIKSKGKGKSGGARVITYVITAEAEVYLLTIYDKSEFEAVSDKTISQLIEQIRSNS